MNIADKYLKLMHDVVQTKSRLMVLIEAKTSNLQLLVTIEASPSEIEKARQEVIDAYTAAIDKGIEMWQIMRRLEKETFGG